MSNIGRARFFSIYFLNFLREFMNKQDLAATLAKKFELSNAKANEVVGFVLDTIAGSLIKGKDVLFVGFGSFSVKKRKARMGRNPQTGESIKIPAKKVVHFSAGKSLKNSVNKK
jgi:Bacterial nucleoid DNA-binding protein